MSFHHHTINRQKRAELTILYIPYYTCHNFLLINNLSENHLYERFSFETIDKNQCKKNKRAGDRARENKALTNGSFFISILHHNCAIYYVRNRLCAIENAYLKEEEEKWKKTHTPHHCLPIAIFVQDTQH